MFSRFHDTITGNIVLKTVIVIAVTQIACADKVCPNDLSYIHNDYCYSIHLQDFNYDDASSFCTENGGALLSKASKDEIKFLERLYTKQETFEYWLGRQYGKDGWRHDSDQTLINSEHQMKRPSKEKHICAALSEVDKGKSRLKALSCLNELYAICEWPDKNCKQTKLGGNCFKFLDTKQNFNVSKSICKREGGRLIELRNKEDQEFYEKAIKNDRTFEKLSDIEVKKQLSKQINIWKGQREQSTSSYNNEGLCEEYHNWTISQLLCNNSMNFICVYEAIENYENTENPTPEMTEQPPSEWSTHLTFNSDDTTQGDDSRFEEVATNLIIPSELPQPTHSSLPNWAIILMSIMGLALLILLSAFVFRPMVNKLLLFYRGNLTEYREVRNIQTTN